MESFLNLFTEKVKYRAKDAKTEMQFMSRGSIPLSPSLLKKRIEPVQTAYVVTDEKGLKRILKSQKRQTDISAFTKGSFGLSTGAMKEAEFLLKVKGKTGFHSPIDIGSMIDRNGRKWILSNGETYSEQDIKTVKSFSGRIRKHMGKLFNKPTFQMDGQEKKEYIAAYYDKAKKMLTPKFIEQLIREMELDNFNPTFSNDEVVLHQYEVLEIERMQDTEWVTDDMIEFYKEDDIRLEKELKIKIARWIDNASVANIDLSKEQITTMPY